MPLDALVLGYVGVMRATTAALLFAALPLIQQQMAQPVKVLCIGNHKLRDFWSYVPEPVRGDVIETGWINYDDLNAYLSAADVTVLPFRRMIATDSIWPSKLNDYLAVARPTVATDMRILQPLFAAHDIGALTDDTPQAFAAGVVAMLRDPQRRARQSIAARHLAEGELSWAHIVARLEGFYERVIGYTQMTR